MIDLHVHTNASDGTMPPAEVVALAAEKRLSAIAVTDHDTIEGVEEAMDAGKEFGVRVVPGVEISVEFKGPRLESGRSGWMHLLVYWPDNGQRSFLNGELAAKLEELQHWRAARNLKIVEALNRLGLEVTLEEVEAVSVRGQVGRPHFARILLEKGYVGSRQEAFDKYLDKGKPAYVDKKRMFPVEAVAMAAQEGGLPVLAHPFSLGIDQDNLRAELAELKRAGLKGLEVYYPQHSRDFVQRLEGIARMLDLVATGGTDFHGANRSEVELGTGIDRNVNVPDKVLDRLFG